MQNFYIIHRIYPVSYTHLNYFYKSAFVREWIMYSGYITVYVKQAVMIKDFLTASFLGIKYLTRLFQCVEMLPQISRVWSAFRFYIFHCFFYDYKINKPQF